MIKTLTTPTIRLEIKASTVVKITLTVAATSVVAKAVSDAATPYIKRLTEKTKEKAEQLSEANDKEQVEQS